MSNPAGIILPFAGTVAPPGCLFCDGSAVSRSTYATLFAVIGTTYGAGDGETTFNIPDLSGRVVIGVSNTHALGTTGGSETVTLTSDQLPTHTHVVPQHGHGNDIAVQTPVLNHSITQPMYQYKNANSASSFRSGSRGVITSKSTQTSTRSTNLSVAEHSSEDCTKGGSVTAKAAFDSDSYGGGEGHNNMQPYTSVTYLIKAGNPEPIEPGMAFFNGFMVATAGGGYITGKTMN